MGSKKRKVSKARDFKKRTQPVELPLPSGNVCLAKRVGLQDLVRSGAVPNSLLGMVQDQIDEAEGRTPKSVSDFVLKDENLEVMAAMIDSVVVMTVLEPTVLPAPEEGEERDEELLYVDEVEDADKQFIFAWSVGGTGSFERFREESASALEGVLGSEEGEHSPE